MTATITTEAPPTVRPVEVGDIFAASWGYDQTNVDFYEVVGVTASGKSARIVPVRQEVVESNGPSERVRAVPGSAAADATPQTKRLRYYDNGDVYLTLNSYTVGRRIGASDTMHQTSYGFGH